MAFELQFDPSEIQTLCDRFAYPKPDGDAVAAGLSIAGGQFTRDNLLAIVKWKAERAISRAAANSDAEIADALRLALVAETERAAMAVLVGLRGVKVPVASAVLAFMNPQRFTIIDFRALHALGAKRRKQPSVGDYLRYLATCRIIAAANGCNLRTLDKALWQWSNERIT